MSLIRSWFSRRPPGARHRWRWGLASGAILAAVAIATAPAAAQATSRPAHAAVPAATPAEQIATNQGAQSLCMNRDGGGYNQGTFIIGYNCGNQNNAFEFYVLSGQCNGGKVSATAKCPFNNQALNQAYDGSDIVEVYSLDSQSCAGTSASNTFTLRLEPCPSSGPAGWNTIMVAQGANGGVPGCLISLHSTNAPGVSGSTIYAAKEMGYTGGITFSPFNYSSSCPTSAQWHVIR